jgi:hypothetical protein
MPEQVGHRLDVYGHDTSQETAAGCPQRVQPTPSTPAASAVSQEIFF